MNPQQVSAQPEFKSMEKANSYFIMKRIIDVTVSLILLTALSPFMAMIAVILHKRETGPVLFKQTRIGKNKRPFIMYNFSTTTPASKVIHAFPPYPHPASWKNGLPDTLHIEHRHCVMTKTGRWLKKYHVVKLPQLWNVLKGDMSLVGPSPEYPAIATHYDGYQSGRLRVKPGMTGFAQMHGLSNSQHSKKIRFDLFYISNCSARLDTKIVFHTIAFLFKSKKM